MRECRFNNSTYVTTYHQKKRRFLISNLVFSIRHHLSLSLSFPIPALRLPLVFGIDSRVVAIPEPQSAIPLGPLMPSAFPGIPRVVS